MILVAGCSWSCGEWPRGDIGGAPVHGGIVQYIKELGQDVLNLGRGGATNLQVANRIESWIQRNPDTHIEKIFVFQTEWTRDKNMLFNEDFSNVKTAQDLPNIWISRWYHHLSKIAQSKNCTVYLIGGISDTLWFDNIDLHYPGLKIACQSMVNLLINQDHRVRIPVLAWYDASTVDLIKRIKQLIPESQIPFLLEMLDQGFERESLVFSTPEYFWPDGKHPNRIGHRVLFDFLRDNSYL